MVESVQEVQVQTGTYSAQYGSYMGVHINLITKSGTNSLHGNLVEFLRNDILDARPYFLKTPTTPKSPLRQNQFGFELDGPIVIPNLYNGRDKTFFMGSYEGLRQIRSTTGLAHGPHASDVQRRLLPDHHADQRSVRRQQPLPRQHHPDIAHLADFAQNPAVLSLNPTCLAGTHQQLHRGHPKQQQHRSDGGPFRPEHRRQHPALVPLPAPDRNLFWPERSTRTATPLTTLYTQQLSPSATLTRSRRTW